MNQVSETPLPNAMDMSFACPEVSKALELESFEAIPRLERLKVETLVLVSCSRAQSAGGLTAERRSGVKHPRPQSLRLEPHLVTCR